MRWVRTMPAVFLILGLSFGSWLSRLPSVRDALDASTLEMSFYGICLAGGSMIGLACSGRIVQRYGPKRTLLATTLAQSAALVIAVWALLNISLTTGLMFLLLYGFMFATADIAMNVSGAEAERAFGKPRMPLMHAGYSTGTVLAMAVGAGSESLDIPVQLHLTAISVVLAVAIVLLARNLPSDRTQPLEAPVTEATGPLTVIAVSGGHQPAFSTATGPITLIAATAARPAQPPAPATPTPHTRPYSPWRNPHILLIGCIALAAGLIDGTASDWIPLALVDGRDVPNATGTLMLGLFFTAIMASRICGSAIITRFGRVNAVRGSAVLGSIGIIMVLTLPSTPMLVIGVCLWGLGSGLGWPIAISAAADRPETAVRDVAAVSALGYGSMLLGPMAFGVLGEWIGLLTTFWLLLLFTLILGLFAHHAREPGTHPQSADKLTR